MSRVEVTRRRLLQTALAAPAALHVSALWAVTDREQAIGDAHWQAYLSGKNPSLPRHSNREAERALQSVALPVCKASTRTNLQWRVGLLQVEPQNINACSVGGGVIFVHDALIALCQNETELAAVIGHEVGHIEYRHSIKSTYAAGVLARYGIDTNWDDAQFRKALELHLHELVADKIIYRSYERLQEYQADAFAVRALHTAGLDPAQTHTIFQKILAVYPDNADINDCLVSNHPQFQDRIARIQALARGYGRAAPRPDSAAFRLLANVVG